MTLPKDKGESSGDTATKRRFVAFTSETINNTNDTEYPGVYPGEDHVWNTSKFRESFKIEFHESSENDSSFSLIGINAAVANAFRRILLAEVPTLAIGTVYMQNNTSVIQDEVLAQRLGLIPFKGSKYGLNFLRAFKQEEDGGTASSATDYNTIVLELHVSCTWKPDGQELFRKGEKDPHILYENAHVYAKQIEWKPQGRQLNWFKGEDGAVRPVNPDVLIAKMRPGQAIHCVIHCHKGIGYEHAKFSPVATASYRLMPSITITEPIFGAHAKKFARCFPRGVIELETVNASQATEKGSAYEGREGEVYAVVADPMKDTVSRECLRHAEFKNKVRLGRIQDHFIFHVESSGQLESNYAFIEAVKILKAKCVRAKKKLAAM